MVFVRLSLQKCGKLVRIECYRRKTFEAMYGTLAVFCILRGLETRNRRRLSNGCLIYLKAFPTTVSIQSIVRNATSKAQKASSYCRMT